MAAIKTKNVVERIRELRNAIPFRSFEIWATNGERYRVIEATRLGLAPDNTVVFFYDHKDCGHTLAPWQIRDAKLFRPRRKRPRRAA